MPCGCVVSSWKTASATTISLGPAAACSRAAVFTTSPTAVKSFCPPFRTLPIEPTPELMPKKERGRSGADDYARLEEHLSFIHAVENDTEPEYTCETAYHNAEVLIAAHHSAENGNIVMDLPLDPTIETSFW